MKNKLFSFRKRANKSGSMFEYQEKKSNAGKGKSFGAQLLLICNPGGQVSD